MSYKQYRLMDLSFFALVGIIAVAISEGVFLMLSDAEFHLSLILLVAFIAGVRWGIYGAFPYFLALLVQLPFGNNLSNWLVLVPYYLVSAISFMIPIEIFRRYKLMRDDSLLRTILIFLLAFVTQALLNGIYYGLVSNENVFGFILSFIAHNLLNLTLVLIFTAVLFKTSNTLFRNMDEYIMNVQEGIEEDDEE